MSRPTITQAWLSNQPAAAALLSRAYATLQSQVDHARAVQCRAHTPWLRPALLQDPAVRSALAVSQGPAHLQLPGSPVRDAHLLALHHPEALTVTTGQQMGLLGGPLFNLAKVATAIALATTLQDELGSPVVPVFWLQNEDHDLPEIDHTWVPGPDCQPLRLGLDPTEAGPPRQSVADRLLPESVAHVAQSLDALLARQPHGPEVAQWLAHLWRPGQSFTRAFTQTIDALFPDAGLVFVDARYPPLAEALLPFHLAALQASQPLADRLLQRDAELAKAGFSGQVHVRPGAPLAFFAPDGPGGERYRLQPEADGWSLVGATPPQLWTPEAVAERAAAVPGSLSSSALLRPLVQDALLPNAAYVAGPGEIAYFAQNSPIYPLLGLPEPMVVPRTRLRVLDQRAAGWIEELSLTAADLRDAQRVAEAIAEASPFGETEALRARLLAPLLYELAGMQPDLVAIDAGLAKPLQHASAHVTETIDKLVARIARSVAASDHTRTDRLAKLRQLLWPNDAPAERVHGPAWYLARYGQRRLMDAVANACARSDGAEVELVLAPAPHAKPPAPHAKPAAGADDAPASPPAEASYA